jgi:hypothetical protein
MIGALALRAVGGRGADGLLGGSEGLAFGFDMMPKSQREVRVIDDEREQQLGLRMSGRSGNNHGSNYFPRDSDVIPRR